MRFAARVAVMMVLIGAGMAPARAHAQTIADFPTLIVGIADTAIAAAAAMPALPADTTLPFSSDITAAALSPAPTAATYGELQSAPKWAIALAAAGPLADGISTMWSMNQSGPAVRVAEGNAFYHLVFGDNVTAAEIMTFKVGQAALMGVAVHYMGKVQPKNAIAAAVMTAAVHSVVTVFNVKTGLSVKRANAAFSVRW